MDYSLAGIKVGQTEKVRIMGVINCSETSFYKGAIRLTAESIAELALKHQEEGADFLDVGAVSTAPIEIYQKNHSKSIQRENDRIIMAIKAIQDAGVNIPISIDTQQSSVADKALNLGVEIINDIYGLKGDSNMANVIADHKASVVVMACKNKPGDITSISAIKNAWNKSVEIGIKAGISQGNIVVDPGIGAWYGRDFIHDRQIIRNLKQLKAQSQPILIAISRKSFLGDMLGLPPEKRLHGSLAATAIAVFNGVDIVRTHDTKETREAIIIAEMFRKA
ncbi:MAG: dihydropteroate synthase, partial [Candidatus Hodarchaeota archaeon]